MKIKLQDLKKLYEAFMYGNDSTFAADTELEVEFRSESIQDSVIGDVISFTASGTKPLPKYDTFPISKSLTVTVEVFGRSESRDPHVVKQESYDLVKAD